MSTDATETVRIFMDDGGPYTPLENCDPAQLQLFMAAIEKVHARCHKLLREKVGHKEAEEK